MSNIVSNLFVLATTVSLIGCQSINAKITTAITSKTTELVDNTNKSAVQPIFQPILPELQRKTEIPLALPTYISEADNLLLVGLIEKSNAFEYQVMLAFSEVCSGGIACRLGSVSGAMLQHIRYLLEGTEVALANNITAYFVDATCGANCSDLTLAWTDNNVFYQVGIKAGKREALVEMANSMTRL